MFKAQKARLNYTEEGQAEFTFTTQLNHSQAQKQAQEIKDILGKGKELEIEVKQSRGKRSLDSNAYMWILSEKIAKEMSKDKVHIYTKVDIYKKAIKEVGKFTVVPIANDEVENWIRDWQRDGIGWFCEIMRESKFEGYTTIMNYHGSSSYNSKQMSRLIDYMVQDAKALGIETLSTTEIAKMNALWGV